MLAIGTVAGLLVAKQDGGTTSTVVQVISVAGLERQTLASQQRESARSNVRAAIPAVEAFNADNAGNDSDADGQVATAGYTGMTLAQLQLYDDSVSGIEVAWANDITYCVQSSVGGFTFRKGGPLAAVQPGKCAALTAPAAPNNLPNGVNCSSYEGNVACSDRVGTGCDIASVRADGYCEGDFYAESEG